MDFRPYVFIETSSKKPSSIAVAGWVGNQMKYITLSGETTPGQLPSVQAIVRSHFAENQGKCHLYGEITSFRFVVSPTESILLDVEGAVIREEKGKFWPRSISMQVDRAPAAE